MPPRRAYYSANALATWDAATRLVAEIERATNGQVSGTFVPSADPQHFVTEFTYTSGGVVHTVGFLSLDQRQRLVTDEERAERPQNLEAPSRR